MRNPLLLAADLQTEATTQPRVSICIPTYNSRSFIERTLAQARSEPDVEIVVVDDASTDDTLELVAACLDSRVRIERAEKRLGPGENFNRCIALARGTYVKILCHDDFLYPGAVSKLADALDRFPVATLATSAWRLIDSAGRTRKTVRLLPNAPEQGSLVDRRRITKISWLFLNRIGCPSSVLLRKSALAGLRFNPQYKQMMDWDLWLRLLERGPLVYVPDTLSGYGMHGETLSEKHRPLAQTALDLTSLSLELTAGLGGAAAGVTLFDVKRLQALCAANALEVAGSNVVFGRWSYVARNLRTALQASAALLTNW